MELKFRKATEKDAETILSMENIVASSTYHPKSTVEDVISDYIRKNNAFMIIDSNDTVIGFLSYEEKGASCVYVNDLTILPGYQNKGIGSKALEFILVRLKDTQRIELITHPKNTPALRLYLKYGFQIEDWKENYYGDGEPRLVLAKVQK